MMQQPYCVPLSVSVIPIRLDACMCCQRGRIVVRYNRKHQIKGIAYYIAGLSSQLGPHFCGHKLLYFPLHYDLIELISNSDCCEHLSRRLRRRHISRDGIRVRITASST